MSLADHETAPRGENGVLQYDPLLDIPWPRSTPLHHRGLNELEDTESHDDAWEKTVLEDEKQSREGQPLLGTDSRPSTVIQKGSITYQLRKPLKAFAGVSNYLNSMLESKKQFTPVAQRGTPPPKLSQPMIGPTKAEWEEYFNHHFPEVYVAVRHQISHLTFDYLNPEVHDGVFHLRHTPPEKIMWNRDEGLENEVLRVDIIDSVWNLSRFSALIKAFEDLQNLQDRIQPAFKVTVGGATYTWEFCGENGDFKSRELRWRVRQVWQTGQTDWLSRRQVKDKKRNLLNMDERDDRWFIVRIGALWDKLDTPLVESAIENGKRTSSPFQLFGPHSIPKSKKSVMVDSVGKRVVRNRQAYLTDRRRRRRELTEALR